MDITSVPVMKDGAQYAQGIAENSCTTQCKSYHGVWLYLRLLGILPSVSQDHEFLQSSLKQIARERKSKVFISGAADFGILSYVLDAYLSERTMSEVTVLDKCPTPLLVNRWYTDRFDVHIRTVEQDFLEFESDAFDCVVAHNFLNFFDKQHREYVFDKWAQILAREGMLVLVSNVKPQAEVKARRIGLAEEELLVARALKAWQQHGLDKHITASKLEHLVRGFSKNTISHHVTDFEEIKQNLERTGFSIESIDMQFGSYSNENNQRKSTRYRVIARKNT